LSLESQMTIYKAVDCALAEPSQASDSLFKDELILGAALLT